jgi:hypothetical protein
VRGGGLPRPRLPCEEGKSPKTEEKITRLWQANNILLLEAESKQITSPSEMHYCRGDLYFSTGPRRSRGSMIAVMSLSEPRKKNKKKTKNF